MRRVLVSDTSVLIDLERGALLDACFTLPWQFAVPDLLYATELAAHGGPALLAKGLRVEALTSAEVQLAQAALAAHVKLSAPDAFVDALALSRAWPLLTGDNPLRLAVAAAGVVAHGLLWICDEIFDAAVLEPLLLADSLQAIGDHPRCRLPRAEIDIRLARYRADEGQSKDICRIPQFPNS